MNHKKVVAIIDDDEDFTQSLCDILEDEEYIVETFSHAPGKTGLRDPDIVLLDLWLGNVQSLSVLEWIRSQWQDSSVIMMSSDQDVTQVARRVKADAVLVKPFRIGSLLDKIACLV